MSFQSIFKEQVALLVSVLPMVAEEDCFALKGGTAINLFVRDLPRLSVDIDLTYLPPADRLESLKTIDEALRRIGNRISGIYPDLHIHESAPSSQQEINKLVIRTPQRLEIKIEVTPVLRGCVYDPVMMSVSEQTEDEFGFARINVLSFADLYAGKLLAALDRQHPRDLYDVYQLLENEGLTETLRTAFIVYLISHDHSPQSLLSPHRKDITAVYEMDFVGMTVDDVPLNLLIKTRERLVDDVVAGMPEDHKNFLYSFYKGEPDWSLLGIDGLDELPSVRWRELNLAKAGPGTREGIIRELEEILSG